MADFAISQLATALGRAATRGHVPQPFAELVHLFNTATGYIQPRDADGAFPSGNPVTAGQCGFGQSGFQEGNAAQYTWMVPQNLRALIDGMGGNAAARQRLDTYFTALNAGPNAARTTGRATSRTSARRGPTTSAGAPWETQRTVRHIVSTRTRRPPAASRATTTSAR